MRFVNVRAACNLSAATSSDGALVLIKSEAESVEACVSLSVSICGPSEAIWPASTAVAFTVGPSICDAHLLNAYTSEIHDDVVRSADTSMTISGKLRNILVYSKQCADLYFGTWVTIRKPTDSLQKMTSSPNSIAALVYDTLCILICTRPLNTMLDALSDDL